MLTRHHREKLTSAVCTCTTILTIEVATWDSGIQTCVSEYRPGPQEESLSFILNAIATYVEVLSVTGEAASMGDVRAAVPSNIGGPRNDCEGVELRVCDGVDDGVSVCVRLGESDCVGVIDREEVKLGLRDAVWLRVLSWLFVRDWVLDGVGVSVDVCVLVGSCVPVWVPVWDWLGVGVKLVDWVMLAVSV